MTPTGSKGAGRRRHVAALYAGAGALLLASASASAESWTATTGFMTSAGPFAYTSTDGDASAPTYWSTSGDVTVYRRGIPGFAYMGFFAKGPAMIMHPGPGGGHDAILRFVAPRTGTYRFEGRFQAPESSDGVEVMAQGYDARLTHIGREAHPFAYSLQLAAGATVDFVVDAHGNDYNDSTDLDLTVTGPDGAVVGADGKPVPGAPAPGGPGQGHSAACPTGYRAGTGAGQITVTANGPGGGTTTTASGIGAGGSSASGMSIVMRRPLPSGYTAASDGTGGTAVTCIPYAAGDLTPDGILLPNPPGDDASMDDFTDYVAQVATIVEQASLDAAGTGQAMGQSIDQLAAGGFIAIPQGGYTTRKRRDPRYIVENDLTVKWVSTSDWRWGPNAFTGDHDHTPYYVAVPLDGDLELVERFCARWNAALPTGGTPRSNYYGWHVTVGGG